MPDGVNRFCGRAENYLKYRPRYPEDIVDLLATECGLKRESTIADIGSGTGILAELFLKRGNRVFAVEPNREMREVAKRLLSHFPNFVSVDGRAERTTLPARSVDLVTAGQAFHWFDQKPARAEFQRILEPDGWLVLAWNERRTDSSPFLRAFEQLLFTFGTDYQRVRHENVEKGLDHFFEPAGFGFAAFDNFQDFDLEGLIGRVLSNSYIPQPSEPGFRPLLKSLREIFLTHQKDGRVRVEYDTKVYYAQLK